MGKNWHLYHWEWDTFCTSKMWAKRQPSWLKQYFTYSHLSLSCFFNNLISNMINKTAFTWNLIILFFHLSCTHNNNSKRWLNEKTKMHVPCLFFFLGKREHKINICFSQISLYLKNALKKFNLLSLSNDHYNVL